MINFTDLKGPIRSDILNKYYYSNFELRYYSFGEIADNIKHIGSILSQHERDDLKKYLLNLRCKFLINEIFQKPNSDFAHALVGICYLSPHIVSKLIHKNALNVFLARDAAYDFLAARLLNEMDVVPNRSIIIYLSRKNLKVAYGLTLKKITDHPKNEEELFKTLKELTKTNKDFRDQINYLQNILVKSGIMKDKEINFFDSWAEGTIFVLIKFAIQMYEWSEHDNKSKRKTNKIHHKLFFSVANPKNKVKVVKNYQDYINTKYDFREYLKIPQYFYEYYKQDGEKQKYLNPSSSKRLIKNDEIERWYKHTGLVFNKKVKPGDFWELMSAKIFKELNHFGSLNFGHPIDWDPIKRKVVISSPDKQIGAYVRQLLMINSVLGLKENYKIYPSKKNQKSGDNSVNGTTFVVLEKKFLINEANAKTLESIIYQNSEHFATCSSFSIENLIRNVISTSNVLGSDFVNSVSMSQNYDFQYYLNYLKNIGSSEYAECLKILVNIYGLNVIKRMFETNLFFFIEEVSNSKKLAKMLTKPIRCVVLDIDGTIDPVEQNILSTAKLLRNGKIVAFITGRPRSYCEYMATIIKKDLKDDYKKYSKNLFFYCSNGCAFFSGEDISLIKLKFFSKDTSKKIKDILHKHGLRIVSEREYRLIAQKTSGHSNPNELSYLRGKLIKEIVRYQPNAGVYLINWNNKTNHEENRYNAIDICASSKGYALENLIKLLNKRYGQFTSSQILVIGDEPDNSDSEIINEEDVSVEGFGAVKTSVILNKLLSLE